MAFNFKGIGNWIQEKILEPLDDVLKGEAGRMNEPPPEGAVKIDDDEGLIDILKGGFEEGIKGGLEEGFDVFWKSVFGEDAPEDKDVQYAGIPKYVIPLVIASIVIYFVIKK